MIRAWAIVILMGAVFSSGYLVLKLSGQKAVLAAENEQLRQVQEETVKRAAKLQVLNMELQASEAAALVSAQEAKSDVQDLAMQNPDFIECFKLHSAVGMRYHQNEL